MEEDKIAKKFIQRVINHQKTRRNPNEDCRTKEEYCDDPTVTLVTNSRRRSYTPLPELIIEKVPPKQNDADEYIDIEEFTIRMRKLHRQLFSIKTESKINDDDSCNLSDTFHVDRNSDNKNKSCSTEGNNCGNSLLSISAHKFCKSKEHMESKVNEDSCNSNAESKLDGDTSLNYEVGETPKGKMLNQASEEFSEEYTVESNADFELDNSNHQMASEDDNDNDTNDSLREESTKDEEFEPNANDEQAAVKYDLIRLNRDKLSTISEETELGSVSTPTLKITEKVKQRLRDDLNESLCRTYDKPTALRTSIASLLSFERHEIEAMRGTKDIRSELFKDNSILNKSFIARDSSSEGQVSQERFDSALVMGMESPSAGIDELGNVTQRSSTPNVESNSRYEQYRFSVDEFEDGATVSPAKRPMVETENTFTVTKKSKVDCSVQTEADENGDEWWGYVRNNFFLGVPRVFNLCSCSNHKCN